MSILRFQFGDLKFEVINCDHLKQSATLSSMAEQRSFIPVERIEQVIFFIRGQKVIIDTDLAVLYGVPTKVLNQAVKRNQSRFPADFVFQLAHDEVEALNRSQIVTGSQKHRDPRFPPYAFTEHGAIMAASVLNSSRAVEVSVYVVRAFVKLREVLATHKELARKVTELENRVAGHDEDIIALVKTIRKLMSPPRPKKSRPIGFLADRNPWNRCRLSSNLCQLAHAIQIVSCSKLITLSHPQSFFLNFNIFSNSLQKKSTACTKPGIPMRGRRCLR